MECFLQVLSESSSKAGGYRLFSYSRHFSEVKQSGLGTGHISSISMAPTHRELYVDHALLLEREACTPTSRSETVPVGITGQVCSVSPSLCPDFFPWVPQTQTGAFASPPEHSEGGPQVWYPPSKTFILPWNPPCMLQHMSAGISLYLTLGKQHFPVLLCCVSAKFMPRFPLQLCASVYIISVDPRGKNNSF